MHNIKLQVLPTDDEVVSAYTMFRENKGISRDIVTLTAGAMLQTQLNNVSVKTMTALLMQQATRHPSDTIAHTAALCMSMKSLLSRITIPGLTLKNPKEHTETFMLISEQPFRENIPARFAQGLLQLLPEILGIDTSGSSNAGR